MATRKDPFVSEQERMLAIKQMANRKNGKTVIPQKMADKFALPRYAKEYEMKKRANKSADKAADLIVRGTEKNNAGMLRRGLLKSSKSERQYDAYKTYQARNELHAYKNRGKKPW